MTEFKIWLSIFFFSFISIFDFYSWQAIKTLIKKKSDRFKSNIRKLWFAQTIFFLSGFVVMNILIPGDKITSVRFYIMALTFCLYVPKVFMSLFLLIDDIQRLFRWIFKFLFSKAKKETAKEEIAESNKISRATFLSQTAAVAGAVPFVLLSKGIIKGAYDYQVHRVPLYLKNLPFAFGGLKVLQLSDIHTGSLFDKDSVHKGIQMAMELNPDVVFFTGDLVNNSTPEAFPLMDHFSQVKAPMGVFSIFGNHDYGDYISWESSEAKQKNLDDLVKVHKDMGWNLLRNEHVLLEKDGQQIALIGVENWGDRGRFQKFGDIEKAMKNIPDVAVKLLMSHDPSHFDAIISKQHPDINATFSGHTHGFQFGIENSFIKWSPSQYIYPHWAGLYKEGEQQLYVNRGYGFLGYPGRVGILPEITLFELRRA